MSTDSRYENPAMGPFEVTLDSSRCESASPLLVRNLDCTHYCACLNIAVGLNWESFTCEGCAGGINETLQWRAGQHRRHDAVVKALCPKPDIKLIRGKGPQES